MEYFLLWIIVLTSIILWIIISKNYLATIQESYGYNFLTDYFVGPWESL